MLQEATNILPGNSGGLGLSREQFCVSALSTPNTYTNMLSQPSDACLSNRGTGVAEAGGLQVRGQSGILRHSLKNQSVQIQVRGGQEDHRGQPTGVTVQ